MACLCQQNVWNRMYIAMQVESIQYFYYQICKQMQPSAMLSHRQRNYSPQHIQISARLFTNKDQLNIDRPQRTSSSKQQIQLLKKKTKQVNARVRESKRYYQGETLFSKGSSSRQKLTVSSDFIRLKFNLQKSVDLRKQENYSKKYCQNQQTDNNEEILHEQEENVTFRFQSQSKTQMRRDHYIHNLKENSKEKLAIFGEYLSPRNKVQLNKKKYESAFDKGNKLTAMREQYLDVAKNKKVQHSLHFPKQLGTNTKPTIRTEEAESIEYSSSEAQFNPGSKTQFKKELFLDGDVSLEKKFSEINEVRPHTTLNALSKSKQSFFPKEKKKIVLKNRLDLESMFLNSIENSKASSNFPLGVTYSEWESGNKKTAPPKKSPAEVKEFKKKNEVEDFKIFLKKLQRYDFVQRYMSEGEIFDMYSTLRKGKVSEHRWILVIVDEVYRKMREKGLLHDIKTSKKQVS